MGAANGKSMGTLKHDPLSLEKGWDSGAPGSTVLCMVMGWRMDGKPGLRVRGLHQPAELLEQWAGVQTLWVEVVPLIEGE